MSTIQLEIPEELAEALTPYRDQLVELLELGLRTQQEREQQERLNQRERLLQVLAASGKVTIPKPYSGEKPYVSHPPAPINCYHKGQQG